MNFDRDRLRQELNLFAILAAFITNIFANVRPLNGENIGAISNTVFSDVLIIPANYAFAIWGLIYLGLISLGIYQALAFNKTEPRLRQLGYELAIASSFQIIWVILFQYRFFTLSLLAMLGILIPLIRLYLRLEINRFIVNRKQGLLINTPISIYFAWITVATIVNAASVLDWLNWNGWGIAPSIWTMIIMIIGAVIAIFVGLRRKDRAFVGVFIWAFLAIAVKHISLPLIAITAILLAIILTFLAFSRNFRPLSR
jgi:hypothetical protein